MVEVGPQSFDQIFFSSSFLSWCPSRFDRPGRKKTRNVLKGWVKIKTSERSATQIEDNNKNKPETPLVPLAKPAKPRNPRGVLKDKARRDDIHDTEAVPAPADKV